MKHARTHCGEKTCQPWVRNAVTCSLHNMVKTMIYGVILFSCIVAVMIYSRANGSDDLSVMARDNPAGGEVPTVRRFVEE